MGFQITPMVRNLLIANVVIFLLQSSMPLIDDYGALYSLYSDRFMPHQFLTHIFLHGNVGHLFGNMITLFFFAPMLEERLGSQRFLVFYMICGIGASLLYSASNALELHTIYQSINDAAQAAAQYAAHPTPGAFEDLMRTYAHDSYRENLEFLRAFRQNPEESTYITQSVEFARNLPVNMSNALTNSRMVGASGAIFGILMGAAMLFPNQEIFMMFFPFPIKMKYLVLFKAVHEIYAIAKATPGDNVAHFAHIGGLLIGYLMIKYWQRRNWRDFS